MAKITFNKGHYDLMCEMLLDMLLNNEVIQHKMLTLDVTALLHTTTINTLNSIRLDLKKAIDNLENQDEWQTSETNQKKLASLKDKKELVNLIIGYKRWKEEQESIKQARKLLLEELDDLKESQKTPEDKIKELEDKLANLKEETL
jgi:chromosome segregation ATPase